MDIGESHHMKWTQAMLLQLTNIDRVILAKDGFEVTHAVGVGCFRFQLESGGYLKVGRVLFVPELRNNLLSFLISEDDKYAVLVCNGLVKFIFDE